MTDTSTPTTSTPTPKDIVVSDGTLGEPSTGTTTIVDSVVEKVAGIAAREVPGVHDLGGGAARAMGALRNVVNQNDQGQGIEVEVGENDVAVAVVVVAEYPVPLHTLAASVRSAVSDAIETLIGRAVRTVDVTISDIHIAADDAPAETDVAPVVAVANPSATDPSATDPASVETV